MRPLFVCSFTTLALVGCGRPNAANIQLRKEIQALNARIDHFERRHQSDRATIEALQREGRTVERLSVERIDRLFTTAGINMLRLTRRVDLERTRPGSEAWAVSFTPVDQSGDDLKASGNMLIELLDGSTLVESHSIDAAESRRYWYSSLVFDGYVIERPWSTIEPVNPLTARVTFTDELTGRRFIAERVMP